MYGEHWSEEGGGGGGAKTGVFFRSFFEGNARLEAVCLMF